MNNSGMSFSSRKPGELQIVPRVDVDPLTGSAVIDVPLRVTPGRSGFGPSLALQYNSSASHSVFGEGWSLAGLSTIGLSGKRHPNYNGKDEAVLNGTEEMVPLLREESGAWRPRIETRDGFWVHYYRCKKEVGFTRFEKWMQKITGRVHWRSRDSANVLSVYGLRLSGESRIADPADPERTYLWQLDAQYDDHGNAIVYDYVAENSENIDFQQAAELDRPRRNNGFAQRYLKRIRYGNTTPLGVDMPEPSENRWLFEITFDYGDHAGDGIPSPAASQSWPARLDPYSNYRAGFEIRTYRLCRRILMFHHFAELASEPTLAGSTELDHHEDAVGSTLESIRYTGYRREAKTGQVSHRSLPPLRFSYASPSVERTFQAAPEQTKENFPAGLSDTRYRWVDLHSEGLPGVLSETSQAWYYKPNLGNGQFGVQQKVAEKPSQRIGSYALSDLDGDGNLNLFVLEGRQAGYCEYDRERGEWLSFRPFASAPHLDLDNGNTRFIDINGDGLTDVLVCDENHLTWYPSEGKDGFGAPVELARPRLASQPQVIGENPALRFFFADMTGDGMLDQVRIQNGRAEYWPQLGNGRFGDGVMMDGAPIFDYDTAFDPNRLRLVDLDGNGTSDLLYIGGGEVRYWINANGNCFVEGGRLADLPYIDNLSTVELLDFLGDGTSCLVWSSPLAAATDNPIQYLRLTSGVVPRLLTQVDNSMGQVTELRYSSSSRHYLRDSEMGTSWISKLPSHSQVVDQKVVRDLIGDSRLITRYEYHDGYFDGEEREFRGFGFVDQYDAEIFADAALPDSRYTPPSCTRTWFHNGAFGWDSRRARDYYGGDPQHALLPAPVIERFPAMESEAFLQGYRALAGQIIRQETFAVSADGRRAEHPYQVSQTAHRLRQLQPSLGGQDACFMYYAGESLAHEYEEQPDDPRIVHNFTLEVDDYGHALKMCTVAYARRSSATDAVNAQQRSYCSAVQQGYIHVDEANRYELGVPAESRQFELSGLRPEHNGLFQWSEIAAALGPPLTAPDDFHVDVDSAGDAPQARLVGWNRSYYWNDEALSALPLGIVGQTTLLHHQETAAFDEALRGEVFGDRVGQMLLEVEGRYVCRDGYWWQASPVQHYLTADGFYLLGREERPDGGRTGYVYDAPNYVLLRETIDALENRTRADIDYNLVAPYRITDPNENVAEALYDALGVIVVSTAQGSIQGPDGAPALYGHDRLSTYTIQPDAEIPAILADPLRFLQNAGQFFHYELDTWERSRLPLRHVALVREQLVHDGRGGGTAAGPVQTLVAYVDGYGRTLQEKRAVGPGPAIRRNERGVIVLGPDGHPEEAHATGRWLVSGHTVYNNKQQPVRQYEPFYSGVPDFEPDSELQQYGVSTHSFYDPAGRLIHQVMPNGTLTRVEITPWVIRRYDPNDTVDESLYKVYRESLPAASPEKQALDKALAHARTPSIVRLDPAGREIGQVDISGDGVNRVTEIRLDSQGNVVTITDPHGRAAFVYRRDMLGQVLREHSIDAGDSWYLFDGFGRAIHHWDGRGVYTRISYDTLDRPTSVHVGGALGLDHVVQRMAYGDSPGFADAALKNARGRLVEHYDEAGLKVVHQYDPEGKPLRMERRLLANYRAEPDWTAPAAVSLDPSSFATATRYDALGRETEQQLPDGTTRFISYLPSGGIARVGVTTADRALDNVYILQESSFNARGQRTRSLFGNGVEINWRYDLETFRMQHLNASRRTSDGAGGRVYQDIEYTYDPVGNVIHLVDQAQQPAPAAADVLQGLRVSSHGSFTYDAFYRLKAATGRVHQGLEQHDHRPGLAPPCMKGTRHLNLNNGAAVERYTRTYDYDLSGNIQRIQHQSATDSARGWTTQMSVSPTSNRSLPALDDNGLPITNLESRFDQNGNCTSMPHLRAMDWNYRNNLSRALIIDRSAEGKPDDAEYYVYGGDGMRVRKVRERLVRSEDASSPGQLEITEKIYLDGCEIKRVSRDGLLLLARTTSHITDGVSRIARLHQWTVDRQASETDDVAQKKVHYQLSNHLGSSSLELDEAGNVISYEEYFPFGGSAFIAGNNVREVRLKEYRYSGKERDDDTGFYYYGYRYCAPWVGRWLSPDPIGPEDALNLYQYAGNNPVTWTDPNGLHCGRCIPPRRSYSTRGPSTVADVQRIQAERLRQAPGLRLTLDRGAPLREPEPPARSGSTSGNLGTEHTAEQLRNRGQATERTAPAHRPDLPAPARGGSTHGTSGRRTTLQHLHADARERARVRQERTVPAPETPVPARSGAMPGALGREATEQALEAQRLDTEQLDRGAPLQAAPDPARLGAMAGTQGHENTVQSLQEAEFDRAALDRNAPVQGTADSPDGTVVTSNTATGSYQFYDSAHDRSDARESRVRNIDWGTVALGTLKTVAGGLALTALFALAATVLAPATLIGLGVTSLVAVGAANTVVRAGEAHQAGHDAGLGALALGYLDITGIPRTVEGASGEEALSGAQLTDEESDLRLAHGLGTLTLILLGGALAARSSFLRAGRSPRLLSEDESFVEFFDRMSAPGSASSSYPQEIGAIEAHIRSIETVFGEGANLRTDSMNRLIVSSFSDQAVTETTRVFALRTGIRVVSTEHLESVARLAGSDIRLLRNVEEIIFFGHGGRRRPVFHDVQEAGTKTVNLGGPHGRMGPDEMAELFVNRYGWNGGYFNLAACDAGAPTLRGFIFAEHLKAAFEARGAVGPVRAPGGYIEATVESRGLPFHFGRGNRDVPWEWF